MESLKNNKNTLLVLALIAIGVLLYFFVFKGEEPLTTTEDSSSAQVLGQDLLSELSRLKALKKINTDLFKDPVFTNLADIQVGVQSKPVGRQNPFLSPGL